MRKLILLLIVFFTCLSISAPISANNFINVPKKSISKEINFYSLELTKENVLFVITQLELHHPDIVLKQAILETGHFKKPNHGNLFGLRHSKGYYKYLHWSESVQAYKDKIQSRYKYPENYYSFLTRIKYAEDPKYIWKLQHIKI